MSNISVLCIAGYAIASQLIVEWMQAGPLGMGCAIAFVAPIAWHCARLDKVGR